MEFFLLQIFALLRPPTLMEAHQQVLGMPLFDFAGIAFISIFVISTLIHTGLGRTIQWTAVDQLALLYVIWCIAISIIYPDKTELKDLVKWITPILTYVVAKNIVETHTDYVKLIFLLLLGLSVPLLVSSIMIWLDMPVALNKQYYATKLKLYQGAYANPANMGYSAFLFIVLGLLYYRVVKLYPNGNGYRLTKARIISYLCFVPSALYCLIQSASRTAMLGLVVFLSVYLLTVAKRWFVVLAGVLLSVVMLFSQSVETLFDDVVKVYEGERPAERIASGRPYMWAHNLSEYSKMPIDRKIAGGGIGNYVGVGEYSPNGESFWPSHNDFLAIFIHTGVVGLSIILLLQFIFLRKIQAIEGKERSIFMAFFIAATAMNFASNSFLTHFGLSQIFFLILVYIELVPNEQKREKNGAMHKIPV